MQSLHHRRHIRIFPFKLLLALIIYLPDLIRLEFLLLSKLYFRVKNIDFPLKELIVLAAFKHPLLDAGVRDLYRDNTLDDYVEFVALIPKMHHVIHALEGLKLEKVGELSLFLVVQILHDFNIFEVLRDGFHILVGPLENRFI